MFKLNLYNSPYKATSDGQFIPDLQYGPENAIARDANALFHSSFERTVCGVARATPVAPITSSDFVNVEQYFQDANWSYASDTRPLLKLPNNSYITEVFAYIVSGLELNGAEANFKLFYYTDDNEQTAQTFHEFTAAMSGGGAVWDNGTNSAWRKLGVMTNSGDALTSDAGEITLYLGGLNSTNVTVGKIAFFVKYLPVLNGDIGKGSYLSGLTQAYTQFGG